MLCSCYNAKVCRYSLHPVILCGGHLMNYGRSAAGSYGFRSAVRGNEPLCNRRNFIMNEEIIKQIEKEQIKEGIPAFRVGDTIRVYARIKEGTRERIQMFEGVVTRRQNGGLRETFTVRRMSYGVGVEKTWPVNSPVLDHIEIVRRGAVRRAKLYYLRDRIGKAAKVKEKI